jgi:methionyl-tRNA formyltransferase
MKVNQKIVFIGGVQVSLFCLEEICKEGIIPVRVFCYNRNLEGRSGYVDFGEISSRYRFSLERTSNINSKENINLINKLSPDLIFVIGWSQLLSEEILHIPPLGCVGIHPTKIPRGRGRAPIPWTIIKGLKKSAVTMFYLKEGVDCGDIISQKDFEVFPWDDAHSLYERIQTIHIELVRENLKPLLGGVAARIPQDHSRATYWPKRSPGDGIIDWQKTAWEIYNWIRALTHPYPGAFTYYKGKRIYIWKADFIKEVSSSHGAKEGAIIGEIYGTGSGNSGVVINAIEGKLGVRRGQFSGEKECDAYELLRTGLIKLGEVFGNE